ncbi:hypothetical protein KM043_005562 [Ampulex compressa]|nr:hypothetical protein KM043_005562 [Ampulex compressa]
MAGRRAFRSAARNRPGEARARHSAGHQAEKTQPDLAQTNLTPDLKYFEYANHESNSYLNQNTQPDLAQTNLTSDLKYFECTNYEPNSYLNQKTQPDLAQTNLTPDLKYFEYANHESNSYLDPNTQQDSQRRVLIQLAHQESASHRSPNGLREREKVPSIVVGACYA